MTTRIKSTASVVVVGSANADLVLRVRDLPGPGETRLATDTSRLPGGKGANQAVAAAGLGFFVFAVACLRLRYAAISFQESSRSPS